METSATSKRKIPKAPPVSTRMPPKDFTPRQNMRLTLSLIHQGLWKFLDF